MALALWNVTDDHSLSVSATRGFKLGGFSLPPLDPRGGFRTGLDPVTQYAAERVWSYEFLSKNTFNDGELTLDLSLFWVDYSAYQACLISAEGFQCNVGDAATRGIELEGRWQATPGLRFDAVFNFLDSRVENLRLVDPTERVTTEDGAPNPLFEEEIDVSGNQLTKAPKFSLTLGGQYDFDLANYGFFGYLTPRFQYRFQTRTYYRVFNLEKFSQKPFNVIDFKVTWRSDDDRLSLEGFVNNITNTNTINSIIVGTIPIGSPILAQYLPPRVWGTRVAYRF